VHSKKDGKVKIDYPKPPWTCTKPRQLAIDAATKLLPKPSSWPNIEPMFEHDGKMKTAEALLKCGPVGQYLYQWLDCDPSYRVLFIELKEVFEKAMRKTSSPTEREEIAEATGRLFTQLEIKMPIQFMTSVRHQCICHIVDNLVDLGPYVHRNTLDFERFHTVFKSLCRNRNNPLASIEAHYELLEFSLKQRLEEPDTWTVAPQRSSAADYIARPLSSHRGAGQLDIALQGTKRQATLSETDFREVQHLWRIFDKRYEAMWVKLERVNKKRKNPKTSPAIDINEFQGNRKWDLSPEELNFQQMTKAITVSTRSPIYLW
jgi:hypothetical protein